MRYLRTAIAASVLTVALVIPSIASAQLNTAQLGAKAQVAEDGFLVRAPVLVNCDVGFNIFVSLRVAKATGNRLNVGFNGAASECTGADQTVIVEIPSSSTIPWKPGKASATGGLSVANPVTGELVQAPLGPQAIHLQK